MATAGSTSQQICAQVLLQPEGSDQDHGDGRQGREHRDHFKQIHNRDLLINDG